MQNFVKNRALARKTQSYLAVALATWPGLAQATDLLRLDRGLCIAAEQHLHQVLRNEDSASLDTVVALLERQGESFARIKPVAILGSQSAARRRAVAFAIESAETDGSFTHFGQFAHRAGTVLLFARRLANLGPPVLTTQEVLVSGRTPHPVRAYLRGPCDQARACARWPRSVAVERSGSEFSIRFRLEEPGYWWSEVTVDAGFGPEVSHLGRWQRTASSLRRQAVKDVASRQRTDGPTETLSRLRQQFGLQPLVASAALDEASRKQATALCQDGWARHVVLGQGPADRAQEAGYSGLVIELATVCSKPSLCARQLEESPAHLLGALDRASTVVGAAEVKADGRTCWALLLGR